MPLRFIAIAKDKPKSMIEADDDCFFSAAGTRYIAVPKYHKRVLSLLSQELGLATVFTLPQDDNPHVTCQWLRGKVDNYGSNDDIFEEAFRATVFFYGACEEDVKITDEARQYLHGRGTEQAVCTSSSQLFPALYALLGNQLGDVWKLVDDLNGTCMVTLKPRSK